MEIGKLVASGKDGVRRFEIRWDGEHYSLFTWMDWMDKGGITHWRERHDIADYSAAHELAMCWLAGRV